MVRDKYKSPIIRFYMATVEVDLTPVWSFLKGLQQFEAGSSGLRTAFDQTQPSRPRHWVIGSARKRPFASGSPLCGNRRLGQFVEQRLRVFEIGRIEASVNQPYTGARRS